MSPLMKQYYEMKSQYPDVILLYRVGDFYETFGEDAVKTSKILGIILTRRAAGNGTFTELAGVPHHAIDMYLPKLVRAGHKVAIVDQLEDPKLAKKIVKRGVTELVTPGVSFNDTLLEQKENNYLAAVKIGRNNICGVAFLDISTGTFKISQGTKEYVDVLIADFSPKEILVQRGIKVDYKTYISSIDEWAFAEEPAMQKVLKQFGAGTLKGFGIENMPLGIAAAGAILSYMELTEHHDIAHIRNIGRIDQGSHVWIDRFTFRNLEVFKPMASEDGKSLLDVIDRCVSPVGARALREWLAMPLKDIEKIAWRHNAVSALIDNYSVCNDIRDSISDIGDLERITAKAAAGKILPREILQLGRGLASIDKIIAAIAPMKPLEQIGDKLNGCLELSELILKTILPDTASQIGKGPVIARGIDEEFDTLKDTLAHSKEILMNIQQKERDATGIASLKIDYNNVFGYYLEVRNMYKSQVPPNWIRKQTLVNAERYITDELKQYEERILGAEEKILAFETQIFRNLVMKVQSKIDVLQRNAAAIAALDCLAGFAVQAVEHNYCRPQVTDSHKIDIKSGRHPVIETLIPAGEEYIPNDLVIDNTPGSEAPQIIILTGPNMSGKSALLRQTALIVLMAQIGSYVPAASAEIGYIDKLFTRVGASDNISRGESTFMVEMTETATILNNLSDRSLVLLDEIGRGTSTYDGMSIAWGIAEYLNNGPKTLFATHYHELNDLETIYPAIKNYHISTKEINGSIVFLRKLCPGGVAHSFGIHVAKLAGMPADVVHRAEIKLSELSSQPDVKELREEAAGTSAQPREAFTPKSIRSRGRKGSTQTEPPVQLSLYQLDDPLLAEIRATLEDIDLNNLSPLAAFDVIRKIKDKL